MILQYITRGNKYYFRNVHQWGEVIMILQYGISLGEMSITSEMYISGGK